MSQKKMVDVANKEIANFNLLYTKLHHYHWFVNGPHFFELHKKLEELYVEISTYYDEVAERLLALGEKPAATIKQYMELTTLEEATGRESTEKMVETIISDFNTVVKELKEGIEFAEEAGDHATADMFGEMQTSLEKHNWMLKAYLGK
ncbi:Dps family protein [Peribacillus alkalitolerans]|uniref:Dps family protein n=1 Tax=Peribacillus alkalitolerans TaxID=1550385 RepID=UPI0013D4CEF7|nr:Dps family protein [Peribacillus alkalitolerans]